MRKSLRSLLAVGRGDRGAWLAGLARAEAVPARGRGRRPPAAAADDQRGRHGLHDDLRGPGHADDARASACSTAAWSAARTCWPRSSRASSCSASSPSSGSSSATAWRSAPTCFDGLIGGLDWVGLKGVGLDAERRLRRDDPAPALHGLPAHVRRDHPGPDLGGVRRADEVLGLPGLHAALGDLRLRPRRALGLGHRRLDQGQLGALDFAGGLVVHVISGVAALCCVLVMGKRKGLGEEEMHPHNLTMTALGTGLLWFGWFGFNAGSALAANTSAVAAFVNTNTAAAAATVALVADRVAAQGQGDRPRRLLRAPSPAWSRSRPAAGFVTPMGAMAIGLLVCVRLLRRDPAQGQARLRRLARRLRRPRRRRGVRRAGRRRLRRRPTARASAATPAACSTATPACSVNQAISVVAAAGVQLRRHLRPAQAGRPGRSASA